VDSFYPVVSLVAFLSGGCFGFYYAWRTGALRTVERKPLRKPAAKPEPLRKAA
jgi:hypothetical protein